MPLPKCSSNEVYDKKSKKCIVIGSDAYKNIVKNNPSAFKHYAAKIAKVTKGQPTCTKPGEVYSKLTKRCVAIGGQGFKAALKKNPNVFNNQFNKIAAWKFSKSLAPKSKPKSPNNIPLSKMFPKSKSPVKSKSPNNIPLSKMFPKSKSPKKLSPYSHMQLLSEASPQNIVVPKPKSKSPKKLSPYSHMQLLSEASPQNIVVPKPKSPVVQQFSGLCGDDKVYSVKTRRCIKIGSQTYKSMLKKFPGIFDSQREKIKMWETGKKLLKPVVEKKKSFKRLPPVRVSQLTKEVFMRKARKVLRNATFKSLDAPTHTNETKIPPYVLIKKQYDVHLNYFDYFPSGNISPLSFEHKPSLTRKRFLLQFYRDNISSHFYKYMLKSNLNPEFIDIEWFIDMQRYISKLSVRERFALMAYTQHGDVYVNFMERDLKLDPKRINILPLFYEFIMYMSDPKKQRADVFAKDSPDVKYFLDKSPKEYTDAINEKSGATMWTMYYKYNSLITPHFKIGFPLILIKNLSNTISSVIKKSPPTRKPMVVFRGVKDSFFTADDYSSKSKSTEVYYNKGFVSTSIKHTVALNTFTSLGGGCCFKVITILPGTRCMPLIGLTHYPMEVEILLDRNVKYIIRDKYQATIPTSAKSSVTNKGSPVKMKISDIIIG